MKNIVSFLFLVFGDKLVIVVVSSREAETRQKQKKDKREREERERQRYRGRGDNSVEKLYCISLAVLLSLRLQSS